MYYYIVFNSQRRPKTFIPYPRIGSSFKFTNPMEGPHYIMSCRDDKDPKSGPGCKSAKGSFQRQEDCAAHSH